MFEEERYELNTHILNRRKVELIEMLNEKNLHRQTPRLNVLRDILLIDKTN